MKLIKNAAFIIDSLSNAGFEAYAVGGCVRDSMLGIEPKDWDICTNALPRQIKSVFDGCRTIDTGIKHGTVSIVLEDEIFEVTTFRVDGEYHDNRRPDNVDFVADIKKDLRRRDFTVNAMAYNEQRGIVDICSSKEDLKNKIIRTVGDSDARFGEDALRIMRGVRFCGVFGFVMESATRASAFKNKALLKNIAVERLYSEFSKLLLSDYAGTVISEYRDVIAVFIKGFDSLDKKRLEKIDCVQNDITSRLFYVLYPLGHENVIACLKGLHCSNAVVSGVGTLCENYNAPLENEKDIKKLLARAGAENAAKIISLNKNDKAHELLQKVIAQNPCVEVSQLAIDGHVLIELGARGRMIGKILNEALEEVLNGEVENTRSELENFAKIRINLS